MSSDNPSNGETLLAAVQSVASSLQLAQAQQSETNAELAELRSDLADLPNVYLAKDVAKAKTRLIAIAGVMLGLLGVGVLVLVLAFHHSAAQRDKDHRAEAQHEAVTIRDNLLAGCQRSNDQRDTLRQVIEKAVANSPTPAGLTPDLQALYDQAQARTAQLRADLLALPGVQSVDCEKAFPPVAGA